MDRPARPAGPRLLDNTAPAESGRNGSCIHGPHQDASTIASSFAQASPKPQPSFIQLHHASRRRRRGDDDLYRSNELNAGGTCVLSVRGRARRSRSPDGRSARAMAEMRGRCVTPSSSAAALAAAASSVWKQEVGGFTHAAHAGAVRHALQLRRRPGRRRLLGLEAESTGVLTHTVDAGAISHAVRLRRRPAAVGPPLLRSGSRKQSRHGRHGRPCVLRRRRVLLTTGRRQSKRNACRTAGAAFHGWSAADCR